MSNGYDSIAGSKKVMSVTCKAHSGPWEPALSASNFFSTISLAPMSQLLRTRKKSNGKYTHVPGGRWTGSPLATMALVENARLPLHWPNRAELDSQTLHAREFSTEGQVASAGVQIVHPQSCAETVSLASNCLALNSCFQLPCQVLTCGPWLPYILLNFQSGHELQVSQIG